MIKKGVFFSTDALVALIIIFLSILVIFPLIKYSPSEDFIQQDVVKVLSLLKVGDIDNSYVQNLISQGVISNLNNSLLEQIGEFYVTDVDLAKEMAEEVLSNISEGDNIGIWYENSLIFSKNTSSFEDSEDIKVDRIIISGIREGDSVTGFSSRSYLSRSMQTKYFYFGGYVGDGNISMNMNYNGDLSSIKFEIAINNDFDLYINNIFSGHYENASSDFHPAEYSIGAYIENFESGENVIELVGDNLHIAGGYVKITYENDDILESNSIRYYLPGIEGLINIYDGVYFPNNLLGMNVYLHYLSNNSIFLNIGNTTTFNDSSDVEIERTLSDGELRGYLSDYEGLIGSTVPIRLGLGEMTGQIGEGVADIVFLIDSTGSMGDEINDVKSIITEFTQVLENSSIDYRLGLIEFQDYPISPCGGSSDFPSLIYTFSGEDFTNNATEFREVVEDISLGWGNDGPESHLRALNDSLTLDWRVNAAKYNILLTDAPPHATDCLQDSWNYWYCGYCLPTVQYWWCSYYNLANCESTQISNDLSCNLGPKSAISVAEDLVEEDITVFYITKESYICGNRIMVDNLTNMTGGDYFSYTEAEGVQDIILYIAGEIVDITYSTQTAVATGEVFSKLFSDSYIEFNYTEEDLPYGLILTSEELFDDAYHGSFDLPENSTFLQADVVSYSGPRWTSEVDLNWQNVYNLSDYNSEYVQLGDPYVVRLSEEYVNTTNNVQVFTGLSFENFSEGSTSNKIIYKVVKNLVSYSPISSYAEGCIWNVEFEDDSELVLNIPLNYSGSSQCYYQELREEYDINDALQSSTYNLLEKLDFDSDGKLDVKFSEQDLGVGYSEISGIPYEWSTEVQVRKWR